MAELHKIFTVIDSNLSTTDVYEIYYDRDEENNGPSNYFRVEKNQTTITTGDDFIFDEQDERDRFRFRTIDHQVSFLNTEGTHLLTFTLVGIFPYARRNSEIVEDTGGSEDVDDMVITLSQTPATDNITADGKITATATGTNSPFSFALGVGAQFYTVAEIATQVSGGSPPFGAVFSGLYTVLAKDSKGFSREGNILVLTQSLAGSQTYGVLYDHTFRDGASQQYKIEIQERGYSGSITTLNESKTIEIVKESESKQIENIQIISKSISVSLVSTSFRQFQSLINGDDQKYKIVFYRDNSGFEKQFESFLEPSQTVEEFYQPNYIIDLVGSDRLSILSSEIWTSNDFESQIDILKICLDATGIIQGYRIAMNIFDAGQNSMTDTPLHQTYIDTSCYENQTYEDIIKHILKPYNAIVESWEGFWYIERLQEKLSSTVTYKEYNSDLVANGSSSYTTRKEFKGATQTDKWRWIGKQSQSYTALYRNINVNLLLQKKDGGLTNSFSSFLNGWTYIAPNSSFTSNSIVVRESLGKVILGVARGDSEVLVKKSGSVEHSISDEIRLKLTIRSKMVDQFDNIITGGRDLSLRGPYFPFKWKLLVGSKWLDVNGSWSDTEVTNQFFITALDQDFVLDIKRTMFGADDTSVYNLFLFGPSIFEADVSGTSTAEVITAMEAITTATLSGGARRIGRVGGTSTDMDLYYYQLRKDSDSSSSSINNIKPTDHSTSGHRWILVDQWGYDHGLYSGDGLYGAFTQSELSDFDLQFFPDGEDAPEKEQLSVLASRSNKQDLSIDLFHSDLTGNISSDQFLYTNFMQLSDGTPTTEWTDSLGTKQLQRHFMEFIQQLYRRPRVTINGQMYADAYVTPLSMLYTSGDDNKVYLITGMSFDYKSRTFDGEVIELSSDSLPIVNDFLEGDFLAADFN